MSLQNFVRGGKENFHVCGPIADDDLALLFRQFSDGLISVETLVNEMKFKKLTNQYSFHTEKALFYLIKNGVQNV